MSERKFNTEDLKYYLKESNKLINKETSIEIKDFEGLSDTAVQSIGKALQNLYFNLRKEEDDAFEEKMKQQRYERGYADSDVWNLSDWFIEMVRPMLQTLRDTHSGSPSYLGVEKVNEKGYRICEGCHEAWDKILDEMIFYLGEMREDTRTRKNPYEAEYANASKEFIERYGLFGDKLLTEEEKEAAKNGKGIRIHTMRELPEYKEITEKYLQEERNLDKYMDECKDKFFELFREHFWALWD